jgi:uncharacterized protein involved in exopolysaccharide biosynthesis
MIKTHKSFSELSEWRLERLMQSAAPSTDIGPVTNKPLGPRKTSAGLIAGSMTMSAVRTFAAENWRRVSLVSILLFLLGCTVLAIYPFRYAATALVVIDPREQRVTTEPDVLAGIGQDAAALQSAIEIAKSDGFLLPLIGKLDVAKDADIAGNETDARRILDRFRSRMDISRRGLTYVVAITFNASNPASAAHYANAIAEAFVSSQTQVRTEAADEASVWLKGRLKTLSDQLRESEDAVAAFKRQYGIVNAGRESTTRQLRVTELNQQVSATRLRMEEARARFEQSRRDASSKVDGPVRSDLLSYLRTQRLQLNDQIAQKTAIFGDRHPDIVIARSQLDALNRQIEAERKRNIDSAKSDYDTLAGQQKSLEKQLASLESEMLVDGQAAVKLQELQRDADANRNIYEQYLSRFKTTNEQRLIQASQTKVASFANQPARSTRPPLAVLLAGLAIASVMTSTAGFALANFKREPEQPPSVVKTEEPSIQVGNNAQWLERLTSPPAPSKPDPLKSVTWARIPQFETVDAMGAGPGSMIGNEADARRSLDGLSDAIAARAGRTVQVLLVTSLEPKLGRTQIASSLSRKLLDRSVRTLLVVIGPDNLAHTVDRANGSITTNAKSLVTLLAERPDSHASGSSTMFEDLDVIVVDAPAIVESPRMSAIAASSDYVAIVSPSGRDEFQMYRQAIAMLSSPGNALYGLIVSQ